MAGVPSIMQALLDKLRLSSISALAYSRERCGRGCARDIGMELGEIAKVNLEVAAILPSISSIGPTRT
jgi:hypothetical protein